MFSRRWLHRELKLSSVVEAVAQEISPFPDRLTAAGRMKQEVGGQQLLDQVELSLVRRNHEPTDKGLVIFSGHRTLPASGSSVPLARESR